MLRLLILLAWFGVVFVAGWAMTAFGWFSTAKGVSDFGSLLSVAGGLGVVLILLLAERNWVSDRIVRGPFSRSARRLQRKGAAGFTRTNRNHLMSSLLAATETDSELPGNVLAEAIARFDDVGPVVEPSGLRSYRNWLHTAVRTSRDSALNRLLLPARSTALADVAERVVAGLDQFLHHELVTAGELTRVEVVRGRGEPDDGIRFTDFVTAFTGAIVLVDATQTRGGSPASLRVWHDRSYRPKEDGNALYSDGHAHDPSVEPLGESCRWGTRMRGEARSRADDYDGRVLDLKAVTMVRDRRNGYVELLMMTDESCYAATEVSPLACKGLGIDDADLTTPRWELDRGTLIARRAAAQSSRLTIVTAFAAIVLEAAGPQGVDHMLVLSRRASGVRNGGDVISITGGGVINLSIEGKPGDEDASGFPDPTGAVIRELEEELGLRLERRSVVPVSAHILNQRGPYRDGARTETGQLVATASFVVHLPMTLAALRGQRVYASSHGGLYESTELVEVEMPAARSQKGNSDEARNLSAARAFARAMKKHSAELDQQAIIAAVYASAAQYTIRATVQAFASVWPRPWYREGWAKSLEPAPPGHDRLARPIELQLDEETFRRVRGVSERLWPTP